MKEGHRVLFTGVWTILKGAKPVHENCQKRFVRDAVVARFFQWAVLEFDVAEQGIAAWTSILLADVNYLIDVGSTSWARSIASDDLEVLIAAVCHVGGDFAH